MTAPRTPEQIADSIGYRLKPDSVYAALIRAARAARTIDTSDATFDSVDWAAAEELITDYDDAAEVTPGDDEAAASRALRDFLFEVVALAKAAGR